MENRVPMMLMVAPSSHGPTAVLFCASVNISFFWFTEKEKEKMNSLSPDELCAYIFFSNLQQLNDFMWGDLKRTGNVFLRGRLLVESNHFANFSLLRQF